MKNPILRETVYFYLANTRFEIQSFVLKKV